MPDPFSAEAMGHLDDAQREAILEEFARAIFGATIPGSGSYQRATRDETPGAAFADRDFGDWAHKVRFEPGAYHSGGKSIDPDTLARARSLKAMIASTTYEGERANAQAGLDKLMAKHGFTERDL